MSKVSKSKIPNAFWCKKHHGIQYPNSVVVKNGAQKQVDTNNYSQFYAMVYFFSFFEPHISYARFTTRRGERDKEGSTVATVNFDRKESKNSKPKKKRKEEKKYYYYLTEQVTVATLSVCKLMWLVFKFQLL
jgi:hypothetical protein